MKKFRLFTLLAIIATISTSFAAWTYINYEVQYTAVSDGITLYVDDPSVTGGEALSVEITNTSMPSVTYVQNADDLSSIDATVSGDVTLKVTENFDGAIAEYSYYYAVYSDRAPLSAFPNIKALSEIESDGTVIVDAVKDNAITLSEDGTATISAAELADAFATTYKLPTSGGKENVQAGLGEFNAVITSISNGPDGIPLKVYAVKN